MTQLAYKRILLTLLLLTTYTTSVNASPEELVEIEPLAIYIPNGFDDNDDIVAIVDGYLPDTCYRLRPAIVTVDSSTQQILIRQRAVRFPGPCLDVTIPYSAVVHLGTLTPGKYKVASKNSETGEVLDVKRSANPGPDDYLYAPVDTAQIEVTPPSKVQVHLYGRFTNTCLRIKEIKVIHSGKTLEVLPIMHKLNKMESGEACENKEVRFDQVENLPEVGPGRYLVHVRSLNGQSVNEVFTNL